MHTFLKTFSANGKFFMHLIDTVTDATFIVDEEEGPQGKRLFVVDSSANVSDSDGNRIGNFVSGQSNRWGFINRQGRQNWTQHTTAEAEGLLHAERVVFAQMLEAA